MAWPVGRKRDMQHVSVPAWRCTPCISVESAPAGRSAYDRDPMSNWAAGGQSHDAQRTHRATAVSVVFVALLVLAGCSSSKPNATSISTASAHGTVTGTLELRGGPPPGTARAVPGTVFAFTSNSYTGTTAATITSGPDSRFSLDLPTGTYYLAATSPSFSINPPPPTPPCRGDKPAVVSVASTRRVDVVCEMK